MFHRKVLAGAGLLILLAVPAARGQATGRERVPEVAQLANGRIVEVSGGGSLMQLRGNTAGLSGAELLRPELTRSLLDLDLSKAEGVAYFIDAREEIDLARAWPRLRAGQVVEIASAEAGGATISRVRGTPTSDVDLRTRPGLPGTRGARSTFSREVVQKIVVTGPIYLWVLGDEGGA